MIQRTVVNNPAPGVVPKFAKVAAADGWLTRTGGGIKYAPTMCGRNQFP